MLHDSTPAVTVHISERVRVLFNSPDNQFAGAGTGPNNLQQKGFLKFDPFFQNPFYTGIINM